MNCPTCFGTGLVLRWSQPFLCETCQGQKVVHCCEGDCAVNDLAPPVHETWTGAGSPSKGS